MGRVIKFILGFLLGFVLFAGIATALLWFRSGDFVGSLLQATITEALGAPAQIEQVKINPIGGRITIPTITISNPSGLVTPYFMQIKELDVTVKPLTLLQPLLQIENFSINSWDINIEQNLSKGNISEIVAYIQQRQPQAQGNEQPREGKQIASSRVTIGVVNTKLRLGFFNQQIDREFKFDNIALTNLTPENAAAVFLDQYVVRLVSATLKSVLSASRDQLQQNLPQLPDLPFLKTDPLKPLQDLIDRLAFP